MKVALEMRDSDLWTDSTQMKGKIEILRGFRRLED